jgi:hypothetical protein
MSTPLVMERSRVQSSLAAPASPNEINEIADSQRWPSRHNSANVSGTRRGNTGKTRGLARSFATKELSALSPIETARFWTKVRGGKPNECWPWTARKNEKGYGRFAQTIAAHRMAYHLIKGPIPDGQIVLHSCDNPACCNPRHLRAGTHLDNSSDAKDRSRLAYGPANGRSRISAEQAAYIRTNPDKKTGRALAVEFGLAESTVSYIRSGRSWTRLAARSCAPAAVSFPACSPAEVQSHQRALPLSGEVL